MPPRALVLGAGITGLAAARSLRRAGAQVTVLEAAARPGGCLVTASSDGFTAELGPNTVQASPAFDQLVADAGAAQHLVSAAPAAQRRFLVHRGRLVALPAGPKEALVTPLLSPAAKLRFLTEPWRRRGPGPEESVESFFRRRVGPAAARLADAVVLGVYAGDPAELAVGAAFPRLAAMEADHRSLFRAAAAARSSAGEEGSKAPPRRLVAFRGGFEAMAQTLAKDLDLHLSTRVESLSGATGGFRVRATSSGMPRDFGAERVIVALPQGPARDLLAPLFTPEDTPAETAPVLPHAPVAVVALGWPREAVAHPLDGFGFLAPASEGREILGALFSSTLFPDRAATGQVLITAMVGGRRRPELVAHDDAALVRRVCRELEELLGARGEPTFLALRRWQPGIPQPTPAWFPLQESYDRLEQRHPGLTVLGNWRTGVGIPACVDAGWGLGC